MSPTVVVVGAGFGGLWAARALDGRGADVVLIDRNNYHTFFPLLYQVAAAEIGPTGIAYPVRSALRGSSVRFRMEEVAGLDLPGRRVVTRGDRIAYDALILSLGSVPRYFGVPGAEAHAFPLRTMDDALPLRLHILGSFERGALLDSPESRRGMLTFVIVGGGPTGVEFAGALAELVYGPLHPDYPDIARGEPNVILVEAGPRVLPGMPERLAGYAHRRLERMGVEVRLGAQVAEVTRTEARLAAGTAIETETVVWTAGVGGDPAVGAWGLPVGPAGRVPVKPTLQVEGWPEVFVIGDLAYLEHDGEPLPQVAPVAIQQGRSAAEGALRVIRGEEPAPFRFKDPGMLAVIGRNAAVADLRAGAFTGLPAWILWLVVHIATLIGFRNRALVLVNWAWNYLTFRRTVRAILPPGAESVEHTGAGRVRARGQGSGLDEGGQARPDGA